MAQVRLILKEEVYGLGEAGDLVSVKPGYARNFLLPQDKAEVATESRVQNAIPELYPGITTIYIAQRISAVIDLDRIVLMENGEITAIVPRREREALLASSRQQWTERAHALFAMAMTRVKAAARRILRALIALEGRRVARSD